MRPMTITLSALATCLIGVACAEDSASTSTDTTVQEDTVIVDAAGTDSAGVADAMLSDTASDDAASVDAGGDDVQPQDVAVVDTMPGDIAAADTVVAEDMGGLEPISFSQVFNEILVPKGCTGGYCHAGHAGGLLMDNLETAYENLVNKETSTETPCEATMRVVPGDPDASMFWVRVRPEADDCLTPEQKMPPFGDGLTDDELKLIHDWILTGANP